MFLQIIDVCVYVSLLLFMVSNLEAKGPKKKQNVNIFKDDKKKVIDNRVNCKTKFDKKNYKHHHTICSMCSFSFPPADAFSITMFSSSFKLSVKFLIHG